MVVSRRRAFDVVLRTVVRNNCAAVDTRESVHIRSGINIA